ncbi:MAG: Glycosyl transferase [Parcubacteria group bacterium GW2011_GWA1_36_12]|nr:MAG: Glycosyl transferase [Parcubacteria group bacterium GW2011_GWA1_36_12]
MKIGFYSPYLDTFGGGERYILTLASHLSKNNQVDVFWDDVTIKAPLARFLRIDLTKIDFEKNIFNKKFLSKALTTKKYDLLFILSDGSVPTTLAPRNILHFQVPFIFPKPSFITKIKLKNYQHVVVNSNFTKKFIDKSFQVNSKVIYPPVDIKLAKVSPKEKIILSVGRFSAAQLHPKKQETLIDVFKEISKEAPGWRLILIGQAKKEDQKYLRSLRKQSRGFAIRIKENVSADGLSQIYAKASIYWHATGFGEDEAKNPEKMEHFGIATVESCASGAVPVVIGKGGQREIVEDGKNGFLWSTKTQLFEKTLELIKHPDLMDKLSRAAISSSTRFSTQKFINDYEKIIFS